MLRSGAEEKAFQVNLRVRKFALPRPGTLIATFGLYPKPLSDWYYGSSFENQLTISNYNKWAAMLVRNRITPKEIGNAFAREVRGPVR